MMQLDLEALQQSLIRRDTGTKREPPTLVPSEHAQSMAAAADEIEECYRVLKRGDTNLVAEILRGYPGDGAFEVSEEPTRRRIAAWMACAHS